MSSPTFHWFLPTGGDGREVGSVTAVQRRSTESTARPPSVAYLAQVAQAAEAAGFTGALTPVGLGCEEPLVLCAAIAQHTQALRFLAAIRPGLVHPAWLAHQAASFQRFTGGRLALNIVTGGDPVEQGALGDFLAHDDRYRRTGEFLSVLRGMWDEEPFDWDGEFFRVAGGGLRLGGAPWPQIYFGGASPAAEAVAAMHADVYLAWGEPPEMVRERVARVRELAEAAGRRVRFGIRLHVISRDTSGEAWREASRLLEGMTDDAIEGAQARFASMDSVGQRRMTDLHSGRLSDLEVAPNLWAGIGLVREGAATALVGSHDEVAERLAEYVELGFTELVLSGYPHLEEAYRVGELVLPLLEKLRIPT